MDSYGTVRLAAKDAGSDHGDGQVIQTLWDGTAVGRAATGPRRDTQRA